MQPSWTNPVTEGRRRLARRAGIVMVLAFALTALAAPSAFAWHGDLKIQKVNLGGPCHATSSSSRSRRRRTSTRTSGSPATRSFDLFGAPSAAGPWIERTGAGPGPAGRQPARPSASLLAGYDHGFNDWVNYTVTEISSAPTAAQRLHDDGLVLDRRRRQVDDRQPGHGAVRQVVLREPGDHDGQTHVSTDGPLPTTPRYVTTCTFANATAPACGSRRRSTTRSRRSPRSPRRSTARRDARRRVGVVVSRPTRRSRTGRTRPT